MYQNRRRQPSLGLMLLFYQLFGVIGIENIPPVTLSCIGLQVTIFLRLFKLPWRDASDVCISVLKVWKKKEFMRLLYGALEHGDDMHLYYNMFSFAIKGQSLERRYGSAKFLYIVACFTVLSSAVLVILNTLACEHLGYDPRECAVGFSAVIFALKVLTTYHTNNYTNHIMGLPVIIPARYAVWVELFLIQIFVPNASFFGHLAGILVGTAYVTGPLKFVMDSLYSAITGNFSSPRPRFTPRTERSGYRSESYHNYVPPGMSEEEQLRRAMEESMHDSYPSHSVPPYSNSHTSRSSPPPPGFVFEDNFSQPYPPPPPPGFSPGRTDGLFNRKNEQYAS